MPAMLVWADCRVPDCQRLGQLEWLYAESMEENRCEVGRTGPRLVGPYSC